MADWQSIETAPKNGSPLLVWDGFSVLVASYMEPDSFEDWWETVGGEDEDPDHEGYEEYLDRANDGWIAYEPYCGDECYLEPTHWMHMPSPPKEGQN